MADALPEWAQEAADDLRARIAAIPPAQRTAALALIRAGVRFGIELSRGEVLPGDNILKVRDRTVDVVPD